MKTYRQCFDILSPNQLAVGDRTGIWEIFDDPAYQNNLRKTICQKNESSSSSSSSIAV